MIICGYSRLSPGQHWWFFYKKKYTYASKFYKHLYVENAISLHWISVFFSELIVYQPCFQIPHVKFQAQEDLMHSVLVFIPLNVCLKYYSQN